MGEYLKMNEVMATLQQEQLIQYSKCPLPCSYMEFEDVGEKIYFVSHEMNRIRFRLKYASTKITLKKEEHVFPFSSFLAEFGGALGMFLGFSFLMVWDFVKIILIKFST